MTPEQTSIEEFFKSLEISDILSFIAFFDDSINKGQVTLYPWQVEMNKKLSKKYSSQNPLEQAICAVNGSGKDKYIIAPLAVFKLCTSVASKVVITSSSGAQITTQTEPSIRNLCFNVNRVMKEMLGIQEFICLNQRHMVCGVMQSEILLFATDEAGRAEGFHPTEVDSEMVLIMNEAKSIDEDIFSALTRCTGYNIWLEISSPGSAKGHFYESCTTGCMEVEYVKAYQCNHISEKNLDKAKRTFGENSAIYRSMKDAAFTSADECTIFLESTIQKNISLPPKKDLARWPLRAGVDVAAGGDEDVLSVWQGNVRIGQDAFRCDEPAEATFTILKLLEKYGFKKENSDWICVDDGGVGRGVTSLMAMHGWSVRRILNQSSATFKREFSNRGAELWFNFKRLVEEGFLILPKEDELFMKQIRSRNYFYKGGKIQLESKIDARSKGRKSPDRADAAVLANALIGVTEALEQRESGREPSVDPLLKFQAESLLAQSQQVATPSSVLRGIYGNKYTGKYTGSKLIRLH